MKLDMKKLKAMKMPEKRMNEKDMEMPMDEDMPEEEMEETPEEEKNESHEEQMKEMEDGTEMHPNTAASQLSDDDLMAEIKKRGLLKELEKDDGMPPESDDMEYGA